MSRPPLEDVNNNNGLVPLGPIPSQAPVAAFNADGIESLVKTKGFKAIHYRHAPSTSINGLSSPANPNVQSSHRGWRYYKPKILYHVPQSIRIEERLQIQGIFKESSVLLNLSGLYADSDEIVNVSVRDLIVFPTLTDLSRERVSYNPNGQKLKRKVKSVDFLADDNHEYVQGRDFVVTPDGIIKWTNSGLRPNNPVDGETILSCVYYYTPIYIIISKPHALRVIPSNDVGHGALPRDAVYAPQLVVARESMIEEEIWRNEKKKNGEETPEDILLDFSNLPPYPKNY